MRWTKEYPEIGDYRTIKVFLLWPRRVDGEHRWLEFAVIKQRLQCISAFGESWVDVKWGNP